MGRVHGRYRRAANTGMNHKGRSTAYLLYNVVVRLELGLLGPRPSYFFHSCIGRRVDEIINSGRTEALCCRHVRLSVRACVRV